MYRYKQLFTICTDGFDPLFDSKVGGFEEEAAPKGLERLGGCRVRFIALEKGEAPMQVRMLQAGVGFARVA